MRGGGGSRAVACALSRASCLPGTVFGRVNIKVFGPAKVDFLTLLTQSSKVQLKSTQVQSGQGKKKREGRISKGKELISKKVNCFKNGRTSRRQGSQRRQPRARRARQGQGRRRARQGPGRRPRWGECAGPTCESPLTCLDPAFEPPLIVTLTCSTTKVPLPPLGLSLHSVSQAAAGLLNMIQPSRFIAVPETLETQPNPTNQPNLPYETRSLTAAAAASGRSR